MTTREEIEAALSRLRTVIEADDCESSAYGAAWRTDPQVQIDSATVVCDVLAERAERQRRIKSAARVIYLSFARHRGIDEANIRNIITRHLDGEKK